MPDNRARHQKATRARRTLAIGDIHGWSLDLNALTDDIAPRAYGVLVAFELSKRREASGINPTSCDGEVIQGSSIVTFHRFSNTHRQEDHDW